MNTSLRDPHFALSMIVSTLYVIEKGTFMEDWDIEYMLLDFMLSEEVIQFCGGGNQGLP